MKILKRVFRSYLLQTWIFFQKLLFHRSNNSFLCVQSLYNKSIFSLSQSHKFGQQLWHSYLGTRCAHSNNKLLPVYMKPWKFYTWTRAYFFRKILHNPRFSVFQSYIVFCNLFVKLTVKRNHLVSKLSHTWLASGSQPQSSVFVYKTKKLLPDSFPTKSLQTAISQLPLW